MTAQVAVVVAYVVVGVLLWGYAGWLWVQVRR